MTAGKMKSVYVMVSDQLGITKIGIASDPEVRRRMLQDASGIKLRLVHASEQRVDARAVEAAAHKLLHEKRKTGEWFDVTLEDAVAAIQEAADAVDEVRGEEASVRHSFRHMTPRDFNAAIKRLGYTQEGFAEAVGAGKRTGQRWATESVPPVVATLVHILVARPELRGVLDGLRDAPVAARVNRRMERRK